MVAYCNATASAQLAAVYPTFSGTYVYGRERLGHWWGFTAGWGFIVGKIASSAAMALTFATYALPGSWWAQRAVAVAAVLTLTRQRGSAPRSLLTTRSLISSTSRVGPWPTSHRIRPINSESSLMAASVSAWPLRRTVSAASR